MTLKDNDLKREKAGASDAPAKKSAKNSALSKERIVAAALKRIDRHGLDDFSLREVARDLKVNPNALYWHIEGGRNAILAEVAGVALGGIAPPVDGTSDWREWLQELLCRYRDAVHRHPNVSSLVGAQLVSNAGMDPELVERLLTVLDGAGFKEDHLVDAYNAVIAAMVGYVTIELAPSPKDNSRAWRIALRQDIEKLSTSEFPLIRRNFKRLANRAFVLRWQSGDEVPIDSGFTMYSAAFIAGLERQLEKISAHTGKS